MKKAKREIIFIIVGLLLMLIPFFINVYSVYRLLSIFLGIVSLEVGLVIDKYDKAWRIVILPIIFFVLSYGIDFGVTHLFNTIPVFSQRFISSDNVIVYNSIFYREYSCSKKIIIDNLYKMEYPCSGDDLKEIDSTSFLNSVLENYNDHKDKFVKINGKISKLNGTYNLEMQAYTLTDESINGYVMFSDNITLEVNFNTIKDLTKYNVYDNITVIGRIDALIKKGDNYIIKMSDSIIMPSDLYETYELSAVENKSCENDKVEYAVTDEGTYYTSCLNNIYVKYTDENVYELSYVLLDKKITINNLIENSIETKEENGNILYDLDTFKILSCKDKNEYIIGNKKLKIDSPYCKAEEPKSNEEL